MGMYTFSFAHSICTPIIGIPTICNPNIIRYLFEKSQLVKIENSVIVLCSEDKGKLLPEGQAQVRRLIEPGEANCLPYR
jgi:hypothetical protein